jgi:putative oxidoreductase
MKKYLYHIRPVAPDLALLLLRISSGGLMAYAHGWPKAEKVLAGDFGFGDPIGIGEFPSLLLTVFAELICGIFVSIGLFTRLALVPLIVTMVVAVSVVHADDPFSKQEFGLLYLFPYATLMLKGPGLWSVDRFLK